MRLKTFLHISDIHFSDSSDESKALLLYSLIPKLDGFLGHSDKSLTILDLFFGDLVNDEQAELIITGDVTRVGGVPEFDMARMYLEDELVPPMGKFVGLRDLNALTLAIPGNHDHYPGIPSLVGGPTSGLNGMFPNMPKVVTSQLGSKGHQLTFLLINTDADVWAWHPQRWAAQGSFVSQLNTLRNQLGPKDEKEIRLLCLHHSRAQLGTLLAIDQVSRDKLSEFIVEQGIAVLLSGHIHQPPLVKIETAVDPVDDTKYADYLEARCGTTTQRNLFHIPYYWRNILNNLHVMNRGHWSNTLLVHRISEIDGEIIWESELFLEKPQDFELATSTHLYSMVDPRVRIWPAPIIPV